MAFLSSEAEKARLVVLSKPLSDKMALAQSPECLPQLLDILSQDNNPKVRFAVAENPKTPEKTLQKLAKTGVSKKWEDREHAIMFGQASPLVMNELVDDPAWQVRLALARKGFAIDKLVNDENQFVRYDIAAKGYALDKLINDPSEEVRAQVAYHGYGLDKLINDPSPYVRETVAKQGYGLDKLIGDPRWQPHP